MDEDMERRFEEAMEALRHCAKRYQDQEIDRLEDDLSGVDPGVGDAPSPLAWHPFYRDKPWLIDWLEGNSSLPSDHLRIPVPSPMRLFNPEPYPTVPSAMNVVVLTKRKAWGWAPYVGRPFVYVWPCAVDDLGRTIAGDTKIVYIEEAERG